MDLSKERLMVLNMIAEGKINAEQGEQLFQALDASVLEEQTLSTGEIPLVPPVPPIPPIPPEPPFPGASRLNVAALAAALREAGIDRLTISDIQELQNYHITPEYIREMRAL